MRLEMQRLILRPFTEADAEDLYRYASDPEVGPRAGWAPHTSVEDSRTVIREILSDPQNCAVVLRETGEVIGSVGVMREGRGTTDVAADEAELGYWIGRPFWGQGLIPEAVRALLAYCFETLRCSAVWCGYYEGNVQSRRVQEKCGFLPHHTVENKADRTGALHTEHINHLTRARWEALFRGEGAR